MAATLPTSIQLRLEQVLDQFRHWQLAAPLRQRPVLVAALGGGLSNHSYLVESDARFVVRIEGMDAAHHGLNRQSEWRILQTASAASLAPVPRYFNPELGALVVDYLAPDEHQDHSPATIASLLQAIHGLPALHSRLDLGDRILRYQHKLALRSQGLPGELEHATSQLAACLDYHRAAPEAAVVCHNDLLPANRLRSGGKLYALDWEYCAMGSPWFDLAVVCCGENFPEQGHEALLSVYLSRAPLAEDRQRLQVAIALYRYLEAVWHLVANSGADAPPLALVEQAFANL